jgi:hypothetical protein
MLTLALVPMLALHISLPPQETARQPGMQPYHVEWEDDDVRVVRVVLAPGERVTAESPAGSVIVYLTANLDGRIPPAEASWQPAGSMELENRGRARFEALVIQYKRTIPASTSTTAEPSQRDAGEMKPSMPAWSGYGYGYVDYSYRERVKSETLVDTGGVTVTKVRQPASMYLEAPEIDSYDRVVVYLRGGYAWPSEPSYSGYSAVPVRRGDVRVLGANEPYSLSNPGGDPSEFIVIGRR